MVKYVEIVKNIIIFRRDVNLKIVNLLWVQ